jgi:hypothetical protein
MLKITKLFFIVRATQVQSAIISLRFFLMCATVLTLFEEKCCFWINFYLKKDKGHRY